MPTQTEAAEPTHHVLRTLVLDRTSPVPLYFQVAQAMEAAISDGRLPPGSRLDNEVYLAEQLGLSRPTMRRAMQYLVDKGVLVRRRGIGTALIAWTYARTRELLDESGSDAPAAIYQYVDEENADAATLGELDTGFVKSVGDICKVGERIQVKVIAIDEQNRVKLSRKAVLLDQQEGAPAAAEAPEEE